MTNQSSYKNMFENFSFSVFKLFAKSIIYLLSDEILIKSLDAVNTEISKRAID